MLQLAAFHSVHIDKDKRKSFYLYVDEFQNFATPSFVQMLSESRKYKLLLTMAEQSTSQQKDQQMVQVILANVGTVICFRTANPADEELLLPLFAPYISENEIANLSAYNFFARLSAVRAQEPLSGKTVLLQDDGNIVVVDRVVKLSQKKYCKVIEQPKQATKTPSLVDKTAKEPTVKPKSKKISSSKTNKTESITNNKHDEMPENTIKKF
jgi:hypothetical protein